MERTNRNDNERRNNDSESWGDMVRGIDAERKSLPWSANVFSRSTTMSLAEVRIRSYQRMRFELGLAVGGH